MIKRISSLLVAAFVVGGLGYGAAQLRAAPITDCETMGYHGPCDPTGSCDDLCLALFPLNGGEGICFTRDWCCMCAEK
jgi:hypothetical protein